MSFVSRVFNFLLLLPLLQGALAIHPSTQKVFQVRGGRAEGRVEGRSGDRPIRADTSHPLTLPPPLLLPPPSPATPPRLPVVAGRVVRAKRSHSLHTSSSPSVNTHRGRHFRSTHRDTHPQVKALRTPRTKPTPNRRTKTNRGLKKARRKKVVSSTSDAARPSYVLSANTDTDKQTGQHDQPYLSPSFIRPNEQVQSFQHYSNFDHHSHEGGGATEAGEAGSPSKATLGSRASRQTGIIDSDTIVKDGQIFHRHDAREEKKGISRGQSRRRHARPGDHQQTLFNEALQRDVRHKGTTHPGGYFTAEALNHGGHSQTRVAGNMPGVDGSAVTLNGGKITQAAVTLGEEPSSRAKITDHHDARDPILASTVGADQQGGSADARARASATATTHAQVEFSPTHYGEAEVGEHGTASALLTPNGESTLATLGGQANQGSYLGTAHSSTLQDPYPPHHTQPSFQREVSHDEGGNGGNTSHGLVDMSDMLGSIMETVHQPHVLPEVAALHPIPHLPSHTKLVAAKEGLEGGNGDSPQKSEISRVPQQLYQEQEGDRPQVTPQAVGQVGIATYFQGELGAPPKDSDLAGYPSEDYKYDPSIYYDLDYPINPQTPYLDLDPRIFSLEPLELDIDSLYPTPAPPPLHHPQPSSSPHSAHQPQPHPSLPLKPPQYPVGTAHQSQTPDQPLSVSDYSFTPDQPHSVSDYSFTPDQPYNIDYYQNLNQPHLPAYSQNPDQSQIPDYNTTDYFHTPNQTQIPDSNTTDQPYIPDYSQTPNQPHISDYSNTLNQPYIPDYSHIPDYSNTTDLLYIPDYSQTPNQPHIPDYSNTPDQPYSHIPDYSQNPDQPHTPDYYQTFNQTHTPDDPHIPGHSQPPDYSQIPDQPQTSHHPIPPQPSTPSSPTPQHIPTQPPSPHHTTAQETHQPPTPTPSDTQLSVAAGGESGRDGMGSGGESGRGSMGSGGTMVMGVPLVPGQPGSTQTLSNGDGGHIINVMTMHANQGMDTSMMHQRSGAPIHAGQKIPGAPGYSVPAGFRGHVFLSHSHPVKTTSHLRAEGNTQARLTAHSPASDTVFAHVSGAQASHQLTSEGGVPGAHVTLGGGGDPRQHHRAPGHHLSMPATGHQGNQWYNTDRHQRVNGPGAGRARPSYRGQSGATLDNDWHHGRNRPSATSMAGSWHQRPTSLPSKSWNGRHSSPQQGGKQCVYITMTCKVMEYSLGMRRQCQPTYNTRDCCC